jgi:cytochrome c553
MRVLISIALASLVLAVSLRAQADMPAWAYSIAPPAPANAPAPAPSAADEATLLRVPGSSRSFTLAQIEDGFGPADWFPEDHPVMPEIVAKGRQPDVRACGSCHYPNGKGRPSNGSVSGLPVAYFIQQIEDFKNGVRKPAEARKNNVNQMIGFAKAMTADEVRTAAEYFGTIPWTPWIRVVETDLAPKTHIEGFIHYVRPGDETEPLGMRIIEAAEDTVQTHGSDLKGAGNVPGDRRPVAELSRAPDVRHAGRDAPGTWRCADETGRRKAHERRLRGDCGVRLVSQLIT